MKKIICFFSLLAFVPSLQTYAQKRDLWQWNTISIDKKLSKKFFVSFDEEVRFFHNISALNLCYTNIGGGYKISKYFKAAFVYRFLQKTEDDRSFSFRHRFYCDISFKDKWKFLSFGYRSRIQTQVRDVYSSEKGTIPETYWRNKFDLKFDWDQKLVPYIAAEFRYQVNNTRTREANYWFNRGRYYAGAEYKLSKVSTFGAYFMLQQEYNINDPERDSVLGIAYGISL